MTELVRQTDPSPASPAPSVVRTPLLTAALGAGRTVERVEVKRIVLAPEQRSGLHLHPCPVVGHVLQGSVFFQVEGEPPQVLRPGDAFYEPAGARVSHFDAREDGVDFVAYYLLGPDQHELITMLE